MNFGGKNYESIEKDNGPRNDLDLCSEYFGDAACGSTIHAGRVEQSERCTEFTKESYG